MYSTSIRATEPYRPEAPELTFYSMPEVPAITRFTTLPYMSRIFTPTQSPIRTSAPLIVWPLGTPLEILNTPKAVRRTPQEFIQGVNTAATQVSAKVADKGTQVDGEDQLITELRRLSRVIDESTRASVDAARRASDVLQEVRRIERSIRTAVRNTETADGEPLRNKLISINNLIIMRNIHL
ncbi:hypothetical protein DPMN_119126 [Dreissena polymorpha]|uniref:Uncharacterized protein n=1 Tax=Dreissena polymorpha TaxID=45954 RepID=A0A9D4GIQ6_DREPO|nr:hypothetical protein DPMN_119126 [Dreissena polymorpha]